MPIAPTDYGQFREFYAGSYHPKSTPISPISKMALDMRNPPHSAGPVGVNNEEYFLTQANYVNQKDACEGQLQAQSMSTSNGNIPHSLV